jgi:hypothetical protein
VALTARARTLLTTTGVVVLLAAAAVGYLMLTGKSEALPSFLGGQGEDPVLCPLTGEEAAQEKQAARPALAVKIENISDSRPQAGLQQADIVYEQQVEGGITRFIAIYQCNNTSRLGPVRSARFVDPNILVQYGSPMFAYSGAIPEVINDVAATGTIQDIGYDSMPDLYVEDPSRSAPHNIYASTTALYPAGKRSAGAPEPVFEYDEEVPGRPGSKKATSIHLPFSGDADVIWTYRKAQNDYVRAHGTTPHTMEDGEQVSTTNIVVMEVELRDTGVLDPAGNPSPEVVVIGTGTAYVLRDGRVIEGTWDRRTEDELITFTSKSGETIKLAPGRTWVELYSGTTPLEIT